MRIMVVDDEEDVIETIKTMLEPEGFEIVPALSSEEAMGRLRRERPDLILLDIALPGNDGWDMLREIKGSEELRSVPVVMLTAKPLTEEIEREELEEVADYITKPFTKADILETIGQIPG
jgi:CheY-like chemotaxis protein